MRLLVALPRDHLFGWVADIAGLKESVLAFVDTEKYLRSGQVDSQSFHGFEHR